VIGLTVTGNACGPQPPFSGVIAKSLGFAMRLMDKLVAAVSPSPVEAPALRHKGLAPLAALCSPHIGTSRSASGADRHGSWRLNVVDTIDGSGEQPGYPCSRGGCRRFQRSYRRSVATTEFAAAFEQLVDGEVAFEDDKVAAIFHPDDRVEA
jgi:hypothetical protein